MTPPPALLTLQLSGSPALHRPGAAPLPLEGRAAALAALAALQPGISRQQVAALLWPDSQDARRNLRQQLLRMRQQIGLAMVDGEERLHLAPTVQLAPAPDGVLLADHEDDASPFGQWLARQRQQQSLQRRNALKADRQAAEDAGQLDQALTIALRLAALEPDDEAAQCDLMRLHYLRGDGAAGLAVYRALQQRLAQVHGARPQPATQALAERLRQADQPARPIQAPPPHAVTLQRPPALVGRDSDLLRLLQAWNQGQAALVQGEAGIGKTRLLAEFTRGRPVLSVAGRPGDSGIPFATLARLLRPHVDPAALAPAERHALAQALPGLAGTGGTAAPAGLPALQAAVAGAIARTGVQGVVVDDLHFADTASVELLVAVMAAMAVVEPVGDGRAGCRWLLAERPHERSQENAGRTPELMRTLIEAGQLVTVPLSPLDEPTLGLLIDNLALTGLRGDAIGPALHRHTGGNVLFVLETLKLGLADGSLAQGRLPSPQRVGALIELRLQVLSEGALALARVAAIAGIDFSIELAEFVIGHSAVQLASTWAELEAAQVLRDQAFAHDLVADAVLRTIPAAVMRRLHAQCAAWLDGQGSTPGRLAWHWRHAGRHAEAARAFVMAAAQAAAASRNVEQAVLLLEAASDFQAIGDQPSRFQVLADRVLALTHEESSDIALQAASQLLAEAANEAQHLRARCVEVDLLAHRGRCAEAVDKGLPLVAEARRQGRMDNLVFVAKPVAGSLRMLGRNNESLALLQPLQTWVHAHASLHERANFLGYLGDSLGSVGRLHESLQVREETLVIERKLGLLAELVVSLVNMAVGHAMVGQVGLAVQRSAEGLALSVELGERSVRTAISRYTHARHLGDWGHHGPALQELQAALPLLQADDLTFWRESSLLQQAANFIRLGQFARALQQLSAFDPPSHARLQATHLGLRLELADQQGRRPDPELAALACRCTPGDQDAGLVTQVAVLRVHAPQACFDQAVHLAGLARQQERLGLLVAAQVWQADAAARLVRRANVLSAASAARDLMAQGYNPEGLHRSEAHARLWQALQATGAGTEAEQALRDGVAWIQQHALPQVPPEFVDSYLHRNVYNRQLLAAASRL